MRQSDFWQCCLVIQTVQYCLCCKTEPIDLGSELSVVTMTNSHSCVETGYTALYVTNRWSFTDLFNELRALLAGEESFFYVCFFKTFWVFFPTLNIDWPHSPDVFFVSRLQRILSKSALNYVAHHLLRTNVRMVCCSRKCCIPSVVVVHVVLICKTTRVHAVVHAWNNVTLNECCRFTGTLAVTVFDLPTDLNW